ncbi:MAG TPA: heterodisulfide reductase-related iron-sulfur binding cluster, partial [Candidatus Binataceae bacterium]
MAEPSVTSSNPVRDVCDYELLFDCVHCGLCAEACPTYIVTRCEMDSPRGRIYLMKSLAEGRIELDDDAARHLDLCLGCRGCETACPSGVHYGRLIEGARAFVEQEHRRGLVDRVKRGAVSAIFPYPNRLQTLLAPLKLVDRLGLRPALRAVMPRTIRDWLDFLPPLEPGSRPLASGTTIAPRADASTVVVHHGCVTQVVANSENLNTERLLAAAGYRVVQIEPTSCCGALDLHSGNAARAGNFARTNVRALKNSGADAIVSAASGCSVAIAEYGELLKDEPEFSEDARAVSSRVRDLSALLLDAPANPKREFRCRVTYHDACHLAHGLGVREAPRRLLASIPGVTIVEMTESDLCCGSAGS